MIGLTVINYKGYHPHAIYRKVHDRFLIIDDNVYLLGASLKDLGNTWGAMMEMKEIRKVDILKSLGN